MKATTKLGKGIAVAVHADRVIVKDGLVNLDKSYFYRHGRDAVSWTNQVVRDLENIGVTVVKVDHKDYYRNWPAQSFWRATVEVVGMNDVAERMLNEYAVDYSNQMGR